MRTSHVAVKRMIADEKNRLTDKQLFGSPQFAAYLTDIAEGATKRYRRSSKVSTYWDTSESAEIAHTDNRIIRLNAGNFLTGSFPTKDLKADSLIGSLAMNAAISCIQTLPCSPLISRHCLGGGFTLPHRRN